MLKNPFQGCSIKCMYACMHACNYMYFFFSFTPSHATPRASTESNLLSLSLRLINSDWVRVWKRHVLALILLLRCVQPRYLVMSYRFARSIIEGFDVSLRQQGSLPEPLGPQSHTEGYPPAGRSLQVPDMKFKLLLPSRNMSLYTYISI